MPADFLNVTVLPVFLGYDAVITFILKPCSCSSELRVYLSIFPGEPGLAGLIAAKDDVFQ